MWDHYVRGPLSLITLHIKYKKLLLWVSRGGCRIEWLLGTHWHTREEGAWCWGILKLVAAAPKREFFGKLWPEGSRREATWEDATGRETQRRSEKTDTTSTTPPFVFFFFWPTLNEHKPTEPRAGCPEEQRTEAAGADPRSRADHLGEFPTTHDPLRAGSYRTHPGKQDSLYTLMHHVGSGRFVLGAGLTFGRGFWLVRAEASLAS